MVPPETRWETLYTIYGEDGIDGTQVEKQSVDTIPGSDESFERRYKIDVLDTENVF